MARFRRLARDYERLSATLEGLHYVAFSLLMLHKAAPLFLLEFITGSKGQAEVGDAGLTFAVDQDVGGLDIPMDQPSGVGVVQSVGNGGN